MKIVSDESVIVIEFGQAFLGGVKILDGLFSVNASMTTATTSGKVENSWYSFREFMEFLIALNHMEKKGFGETRLQESFEAGEDYGLFGDTFQLFFSMSMDTHLQCRSIFHAHRADLYVNGKSDMLTHSFGIDRTKIADLVADFETLKGLIVEELERLLKENLDG